MNVICGLVNGFLIASIAIASRKIPAMPISSGITAIIIMGFKIVTMGLLVFI